MTSALGISTAPTTEVSLRSKVRSLEAANEHVRDVFDERFPMHKIIMNQAGVELRTTVVVLGRLVFEKIGNYRALFGNKSLPDAKRTLNEDQLQTIERVFKRLTDGSPNDDLSRVGQLTLFFAGLVIEHAFFRQFLPDVKQSIRRFAPDDSVLPSASFGPDVRSAEFLRRRAVVAFVSRYLHQQYTQLIDGTNEVLESSDTFVENCVNCYLAQLPAYMPIEIATAQRGAAGTKK